MKSSFLSTALIVATLALSAASTSALAATAQQEKMKTCNGQAAEKNLAGEERKAFMRTCLSADSKPTGKHLTAQQEKMSNCNAEAKTKGLSGAERKAFMSTCLKGG